MNKSEILGKAIKDFAEPKMPGITKQQARQLIDLVGINDGYGWKQYQFKILSEEMKKKAGNNFDLETLESMARYNYPDDAKEYIPALSVFGLFFLILAVVLF